MTICVFDVICHVGDVCDVMGSGWDFNQLSYSMMTLCELNSEGGNCGGGSRMEALALGRITIMKANCIVHILFS